MKLTLGFSPCPNDTFIFDAMIHGRIPTEGLEFDVVMADVEELNRRAFAGELDMTKLSYHAFAYLTDTYVLLTAGSALGNNCGPLLIARQPLQEEEIFKGRIAIPGKYTTANFLFSLAYPGATDKVELLFSEIERAVIDEEVTAGLIIHENRFTYREKGLVKLVDLGEFWENRTGLPIPLGGIAVKRALPSDLQQKINRVMERSVRYAMDHPEASKNFVKKYAQEMRPEVMHEHIKLYVNNYTVNLGKTGESAVNQLFKSAGEAGIIPSYKENILIN